MKKAHDFVIKRNKTLSEEIYPAKWKKPRKGFESCRDKTNRMFLCRGYTTDEGEYNQRSDGLMPLQIYDKNRSMTCGLSSMKCCMML